MNAQSEPKLAPPGAGLPTLELYIARILFAVRRWRGNRNLFNAHFQQEREAIRALVRACDSDSAARRVLIRRPRGLEDSSRYWSVWMTLDHLRIVNLGIAGTIRALAKGVIPSRKASTAAVKPNGEASGAVVAEFEESCEALLAAVAGGSHLKTAVRFAHPWFGPLDAVGWHALAGGHMGIHRVQLERILQGLAQS